MDDLAQSARLLNERLEGAHDNVVDEYRGYRLQRNLKWHNDILLKVEDSITTPVISNDICREIANDFNRRTEEAIVNHFDCDMSDFKEYLRIKAEDPKAEIGLIRHGSWIVYSFNEHFRLVKCDQCGYAEKRSYDMLLPRYCQGCGAKMDKQDQDK